MQKFCYSNIDTFNDTPFYVAAGNRLKPVEELHKGDPVPESEYPQNYTTHTLTVHGDEQASESMEVPNILTLLQKSPLKEKSWVKTLVTWQNPFFSLLPVLVLSFVVIKVYRKRTFIPGRLQNLLETIVEGIDTFVGEIMGKEEGRRFLPYVGSLFLFIFFNNLMGIIPLVKPPTSSFRTTLALAICTFIYVQYVSMSRRGILGYLHHLAGSPRGIVLWLVVPLLLPIHIIGELAKVASLALRLFGNIFGEDTLIGVFTLLGLMAMGILGFQQPVVGLPLQLPFMLLAVLTSFVQALVFSLLSMIYFIMVIPTDEH